MNAKKKNNVRISLLGMRRAGRSGTKINVICRSNEWVAVAEGSLRAQVKSIDKDHVIQYAVNQSSKQKEQSTVIVHDTDGSVMSVIQ